MRAPEPLTIWSLSQRALGRDAGPSATSQPSRAHTPGEEDPLTTWVARIGTLVLALTLTITLIVLMGDTMSSVFATG
jgi:hypothetical protein